MVIAVASGKGGTGKTTISTSLALVTPQVQFIDADVEEPNAHIFLQPDHLIQQSAALKIPSIDLSVCTRCGLCQEICEFNALAVLPESEKGPGNVFLFETLCHGCGACYHLCPENAITERAKEIGIVESGVFQNLQDENCEFIHGVLNLNESLTTPVIKDVKEQIDSQKTDIIDAPPGTSCPMIEAVEDSDYCILVTEPTPFGLHDLDLAVEVIRQMDIPHGVIVNRSQDRHNIITDYCGKRNIPILLQIPYSKRIAEGYSKGIPLVKIDPHYIKQFQELLLAIQNYYLKDISSALNQSLLFADPHFFDENAQ